MATMALVIGVGKYRRLEADGGDDLWGAENDAAAWQTWLQQKFGADPVEVLSTADGHAAPTGAAILEAVSRLADRMRAAGPTAAGLITFSGHGAALPDTGADGRGFAQTLALVPCDAARDASGAVGGAVLFSDVMKALGDVASEVTLCVDACYTTGSGDLRERRVVSGAAGADAPPVVGRVLLGCQPWAASYEFTAGERRRGAFSFALLTLLEQWRVIQGPAGRYVNVSYEDLVFRVRELLRVLGVAQVPVLIGTSHMGLVPFLRPGPAIALGDTSPEPDQPRHGSQLDAGTTGDYRIYTIATTTTAVVAHVVVPRTTYTSGTHSWTTSQEYWYLNAMAGTPSGDITVTLTKDGGTWPASGLPSWSFLSDTLAPGPRAATWSSTKPTLPSNTVGWCVRPSGSWSYAPSRVALTWQTSPKLLTTFWWYNGTNSATTFFGSLAEGGSVTFTSGSTPNAGYWFQQDTPTS